jgi:uncharacterized protein
VILRLCPVSLLLLLWSVGGAFAAPQFPELTGRVVDEAGLLSEAARTGLVQRLEAHERETSNQLVVVTLASLQGYAIEDFGYQLGRHWGIGQAGRDNGVLLIVAPNERKVRIEVGYGLEGALTDALSSQIIQNEILPRFRADDFEGGLLAGADAVMGAVKGEYEPLPSPNGRPDVPAQMFMAFVVLTMLGEMLGGLVRSRLATSGILGGVAFLVGWLLVGSLPIGAVMGVLVGLFYYLLGGGGSGRGGRYSGGGYSGGGGFGGGGFSGGGGSFGGGGASGSW